MLYAGTEHGFYLSYDDGDHWQPLSSGLPDTQVSDIWVESDSIAIATHGRSFYILDDLAPLRQAGVGTPRDFHLFKPADVVRGGGNASIPYLLRKPAEKLTIEILDSKGQVAQTIQGTVPGSGRGGRGGRGSAAVGAEGARGAQGATGAQGARGAAPEEATQAEEFGGRGRGGPPTTTMAAGLNRANWNLDYASAVTFPGMILWGATTNGPTALPGVYQVRMTVDGKTQTQSFAVEKNPLRNTP